MQGVAAQKAAKAQAEIYENNARIADQQAVEEVKIGGREEGSIRRKAAFIAGKQNAQAAASGLASGSGSVADAFIQSSVNEERDVARNAINHARTAWGYNVEATNYRNQASAARAQGRNAFTAGLIGAGTSLLSLAAPKVDSWMKGPTTGASFKVADTMMGPLGPEYRAQETLGLTNGIGYHLPTVNLSRGWARKWR